MRPEAIVEILDLAEKYVQLNRSKDKRAGSLTGLTQINMFFENSTRTQASFELAGKRLGANVMNLSMEASFRLSIRFTISAGTFSFFSFPIVRSLAVFGIHLLPSINLIN